MNRKIILLILSDTLILSSFGLIAPIFAIFIKENLAGGSLITAGLAISIFLIVKSLVQLPLSMYIDKKRRKTNLLILGALLIVTVPFIYYFSNTVYGIFVAQAIYGIGAAMAYPAWFSLFVTYVNKKHRGFEWAVWSTSIGIGTAITAYIGANIAKNIGFKFLFFVMGGLAFFGFLILFFLDRKYNKFIKKELVTFKSNYFKITETKK